MALAAIGLVLAAARSGRTSTVTSVTSPAPADRSTAPPASPGPQESTAPGGHQATPPLVIDAFFSLLVAVLLALLGFVGWTWMRRAGGRWVRRRRLPRRQPHPPPIPAGPAPEALTEAVDAGLRRVDEGEPQDAVIACWVLLEGAAAAAGTARRPAETPAQLVARVLAEHRVTEHALDRLATLYREARYSQHVLGEPARAEARGALERIRRDLTGAARVR